MFRWIVILILSAGLSAPLWAEKEKATKGVSNDVRESDNQGNADDQGRHAGDKEKVDDSDSKSDAQVKEKEGDDKKTDEETKAKDEKEKGDDDQEKPKLKATATPRPRPTTKPTREAEEHEEATEEPTQGPTQRPTRIPTAEPTAEPSEEMTGAPTPAPTQRPARVPTAEPTELPTEAATEIPTLAPTPAPTQRPTRVPTAEPTEMPTEAATEIPTLAPTLRPTQIPTIQPTALPTEEATQAPTPAPTARPSSAPSMAPTQVPSPLPTEHEKHDPALTPTHARPAPTIAPTQTAVPPSLVPTKEPTPVRKSNVVPTAAATQAWPTAAPTLPWPTAVPTLAWRPTPAPEDNPRPVRGRVIRQRQEQRGETPPPSRGSGTIGGTRMKTRVYSGGATASGSPRRAPGDPDKLSTLMFTLPLGVGKPYDVKPAFKPDSATLDSRNIDSSSFIGFAVEGRLMRYLRIFGDWTVYNHSTLAAKASLNAPAVDLPGVASVISSSDIRYDMTTHGFRLGGKLGFPLGSHVEPWIGGGGGFYVWSASYQDKEGFYSYGDDHGVELGLTGMGGVDFTMNAGGLLLRLTPYGELGAPVVHPTISDIGGTGGTWHDNQGTAVMVPRRLGLMLSLGF